MWKYKIAGIVGISSMLLMGSGVGNNFNSMLLLNNAQAQARKASVNAVQKLVLMLDYEGGYGGYVYPVYNPYVFYKNGRVVKEPKVPIQELKLNAMNKDQAYNWGTWTQKGGSVFIVWHNSKGKKTEKKWSNSHPAHRAVKGQKIEGRFSSFSGGGNIAFGGSVGVASISQITFAKNGKFTTENVASSSSTSGTAWSQKNTAGVYSLDGYTITLRYNSGASKKLFFCFFSGKGGKKDESVFRIAGRTYTRKK